MASSRPGDWSRSRPPGAGGLVRPLVLSGFMATGKSTLGPLLASRLGVPFCDTDEEVARRAGKFVPDLWREEGEAAFRAREADVAEEWLRDETPRVIAFGGGTVTIRKIRHLALERSILITLTAPPEVIVGRVSSLADRPNLRTNDPLARARDLLEQRADAYAECHAAIDTSKQSPEMTIAAIEDVIARDPLCMPLQSRTYSVDVGIGVTPRIVPLLQRLSPSGIVLVSDTGVANARKDDFEKLAKVLVPAATVVLSEGESNKTLAAVEQIWNAALKGGADRRGLVVAFGGGVVGDLAGFAASTLLRGVRFVQIPTTLLAMVDASVGGKTSFDHAAGKNLIGSFHQPSFVLADLNHLATLPERHIRAGLAEVIKIAATSDAALFEHLETMPVPVASRDTLIPIVRAAIAAKIRIVRDDERESDLRAILNLGHTLAHAIEAESGYRTWLHGEAVALGIVLEMRAAATIGIVTSGIVSRLEALLNKFGLLTTVEKERLNAAWPYVWADKKRVASTLHLPVVHSPGRSEIAKIPPNELAKALGIGSLTT